MAIRFTGAPGSFSLGIGYDVPWEEEGNFSNLSNSHIWHGKRKAILVISRTYLQQWERQATTAQSHTVRKDYLRRNRRSRSGRVF